MELVAHAVRPRCASDARCGHGAADLASPPQQLAAAHINSQSVPCETARRAVWRGCDQWWRMARQGARPALVSTAASSVAPRTVSARQIICTRSGPVSVDRAGSSCAHAVTAPHGKLAAWPIAPLGRSIKRSFRTQLLRLRTPPHHHTAELTVLCRVMVGARGMGAPMTSQAQGTAPAPSSSTPEYSEPVSADATTSAAEAIPPRVVVNAEAQTPLNPWQRCVPPGAFSLPLHPHLLALCTKARPACSHNPSPCAAHPVRRDSSPKPAAASWARPAALHALSQTSADAPQVLPPP